MYTGEVGDEGWHALKTIPNSWINAGPSGNGLLNFLAPGPGLGGGEDDRRRFYWTKFPMSTPCAPLDWPGEWKTVVAFGFTMATSASITLR
nr:hypothetical protein [Haliscomenobacter sp.]